MMDKDHIPSNSSSGTIKSSDDIKGIDINYNIDTADMIVGAVFVNSSRSPQYTVVGKIFIYKYTTPRFIEVNFDETYISYLFDDAEDASKSIGNYTLKMLTLDFPGSVLNMSSSTDIGLVQLPGSIYKS